MVFVDSAAREPQDDTTDGYRAALTPIARAAPRHGFSGQKYIADVELERERVGASGVNANWHAARDDKKNVQ